MNSDIFRQAVEDLTSPTRRKGRTISAYAAAGGSTPKPVRTGRVTGFSLSGGAQTEDAPEKFETETMRRQKDASTREGAMAAIDKVREGVITSGYRADGFRKFALAQVDSEIAAHGKVRGEWLMAQLRDIAQAQDAKHGTDTTGKVMEALSLPFGPQVIIGEGSLRPLTPEEKARAQAQYESERVPLGPIGQFQRQAEDAAGQVGKWLPTMGGEPVARGLVGAGMSLLSSGEMMNDPRVPEFDRKMAAAQFFTGILTAVTGGGFVAHFTTSGGSLAQGVLGSVGALKEAAPEMASHIDEAAAVLSRMPEQEADGLLRQAAEAHAPHSVTDDAVEPAPKIADPIAPGPPKTSASGLIDPIDPEAPVPEFLRKHREKRDAGTAVPTAEPPPGAAGVPEPPVLSQADVVPKRRTVMDVDADIEAVTAEIKNPGGSRLRRGAVSVGPQDVTRALKLGALYLEKGYRTFDEWSRQMIATFGASIKPHLSSVWNEVSKVPKSGPVQVLSDALKESTLLRGTVAADVAKQARARTAAVQASYQAKGGGLGTMGQEMGAFKGTYANHLIELPETLDYADVDHMAQVIDAYEYMSPQAKTATKAALQRLFGLDPGGDPRFGVLPQPHEIANLSKVFGLDFGTQLRTMARPTLWQELSSWRKMGLLTNARTIQRNAIGNLVKAVRNSALRPADAALDMLVSPISGQRSVTGAPVVTAGTVKRAASRALRDMRDVVRHGAETTFGEAAPESRFFLTKWMQRGQGVQDVPWKALAYETSIVEQAKLEAKALRLKGAEARAHVRALVDSPTEAMGTQAKASAEFATFNNENKLADWLRSDKVPGEDFGQFVVDLFMPFKTVPLNIGADIATSNPLGAVYNLAKTIAKARAGALSAAEQAHLVRSMNNGVLGTGLMWLGWEMAHRGQLTGAPSSSDRSLNETEQALGAPPTSFFMNGKAYNVGSVNPFFNVMLLGATVYDRTRERMDREEAKAAKADFFEEGKDTSVPEGFGGMAGALKDRPGAVFDAFQAVLREQSFYKGIKDALDAASSEKSWNQYGAETAASFVPTAVEDAGRTFGGDKGVKRPQTVSEALQERTGRGFGLPTKADVLGTRVQMESSAFDLFNTRTALKGEAAEFLRKHRVRIGTVGKEEGETEKSYQARRESLGKLVKQRIEEDLPFLKGETNRVAVQREIDRIVRDAKQELRSGLGR